MSNLAENNRWLPAVNDLRAPASDEAPELPHDQLVKVWLPVEPERGPDSWCEVVWAEPCGISQFRLRNSPWFVRGLSYRDIVNAPEEAGRPRFAGVTKPSGHSNVWLWSKRNADGQFEECWQPLEDLGCRWEEGEIRNGISHLAADVPAEVPLQSVMALLQAGQERGAWDFEVSNPPMVDYGE